MVEMQTACAVSSSSLLAVHTSTRLDLPLHLLELLVHPEQVVPLRVGRRLVRLGQLPVQLFVFLVVPLEPLGELDCLAEAEVGNGGRRG